MPAINITIQGLDKLTRAFAKAPEKIFIELNKTVQTSVRLTRPIMKQEAPVLTGKLRRNIYTKTQNLMGEVAPNLEMTPYALYVHEGMGNIRRKNQFVNRTADKVRPQIEAIFKRSTDSILKSLAVN